MPSASLTSLMGSETRPEMVSVNRPVPIQERMSISSLATVAPALLDSQAGDSVATTKVDVPLHGEGSAPCRKIAWLQVFAGFWIHFVLTGWRGCSGLFLIHYSQSLQRPTDDIAWIAALETFFAFVPSALIGRYCDKGYSKKILVAGTLMLSTAAMVVSFLTSQYIALIVLQGVIMGISRCMIWIPAHFILCTYFEPNKLPIALAVTHAGSGVGSLIFPVILEHAQPTLGFDNTIRLLAGLSFIILILSACISVTRRTIVHAEKRPLLHLGAFKRLSYCLTLLSSFLLCFVGYAATTFANAYGRDTFHVKEAETLPINLIREGVSIPAGAFFAWVSYKYFGSLNLCIGLTGLSALAYFLWTQVQSMTGLLVWMFAKGIMHGGLGIMIVAVVSQVVRSPHLFGDSLGLWGARLGMIATIDGLGGLGGPLVFARLLTLANGSYLPGQLFCGIGLTMATGALIVLRAQFGKYMARETSRIEG